MMYSKSSFECAPHSEVLCPSNFAAQIDEGRLIRSQGRKLIAFALVSILGLAMFRPARGATLLAEPFNYSAGSSLGAASPWSGNANSSLGVVSGNLSLTNLQSIVPSGNKLQVTSGATASAYRTFSSTPVTSGAVYCSFLLDCSTLPTNSQFTACLLTSGVTTASPPDDPLDLYVRPSGGGYSFSIRTAGSDPASAGRILAKDSTHLIVLKYAFGLIGQASLYIDPAPGGTEPVPDATASTDDDEVGNAPSNLQGILFRASASVGQGTWSVDTLRVGNTWADVTPFVAPLSVVGPFNQAVCFGSPATFTVTAYGTPPYSYSWRTNGVLISGATNSEYQLPSPGVADALNGYDVIVRDGFGAFTSEVARLTISMSEAAIVTAPANQIVTPTTTQAVFSVTAAGDAPLTYQWRSNGVAIEGATNDSFAISNPTSADQAIAYDVVVSNPCRATNSPPVSLIFPHVFYAAFDAGPGFFSGENLELTNHGGLTLQAWSSTSLPVPVTDWNLEGTLQEQPFNDGSGLSLYSINVTPAASPAYYIFGTSVAPPYLMPIPVLVVTADSSGFFNVASSNMVIAPDGTLATPGAPILIQRNSGGGLELTSVGTPGNPYVLQASATLQPPIQWVTIETNVADVSGLIRFAETNTSSPSRFYRLTTP